MLTDFESTRKTIDSETGKVEYIDLCNKCFKSVSEEVSVVERSDLATEDDVSTESDEEVLWDRVTWSDEEDEQ